MADSVRAASGAANATSVERPSEPEVNGCGPGGDSIGNRVLNKVIPEGFFPELGGYDFSPACDRHDICYGTAGAEKDTCDENFLNDLTTQCKRWTDRLYGPTGIFSKLGDGFFKKLDTSACLVDAKSFYLAVKNFGKEAFERGQTEASSQIVSSETNLKK